MNGGGEVKGAGHVAGSITMSAAAAQAVADDLKKIEKSGDGKEGFNPKELENAKTYLATIGIKAGVTEATLKRFVADIGAAAKAASAKKPEMKCEGEEGQRSCKMVAADAGIEIITVDGAFAMINVDGAQVAKDADAGSKGGVLRAKKGSDQWNQVEWRDLRNQLEGFNVETPEVDSGRGKDDLINKMREINIEDLRPRDTIIVKD